MILIAFNFFSTGACNEVLRQAIESEAEERNNNTQHHSGGNSTIRGK